MTNDKNKKIRKLYKLFFNELKEVLSVSRENLSTGVGRPYNKGTYGDRFIICTPNQLGVLAERIEDKIKPLRNEIIHLLEDPNDVPKRLKLPLIINEGLQATLTLNTSESVKTINKKTALFHAEDWIEKNNKFIKKYPYEIFAWELETENERALAELNKFDEEQMFQLRNQSTECKLNFIDLDNKVHRIFENNGVFINANIKTLEGSTHRRTRSDRKYRKKIVFGYKTKSSTKFLSIYVV